MEEVDGQRLGFAGLGLDIAARSTIHKPVTFASSADISSVTHIGTTRALAYIQWLGFEQIGYRFAIMKNLGALLSLEILNDVR